MSQVVYLYKVYTEGLARASYSDYYDFKKAETLLNSMNSDIDNKIFPEDLILDNFISELNTIFYGFRLQGWKPSDILYVGNKVDYCYPSYDSYNNIKERYSKYISLLKEIDPKVTNELHKI